MDPRLETTAVQRQLASTLRAHVRRAAGDDHIVQAGEREKLKGLAREAADALGRGRHSADAIVDKAMSDAMAAWAAINPPGTASGKYLSKREITELKRTNPTLGEATETAAAIVRRRRAGALTQARALAKARTAALDYLKNERMSEPGWSLELPQTWADAVARGALSSGARFADPANPDSEVFDKPDRWVFTGRGPLDLYTEIEIAKKDGRVLRRLIEAD